MSTPMHSTATAGPAPRLSLALVEASRMLRSTIQRLDGWREARRRAAQDRDALANMSARELRDIGIVRCGADDVTVDTAWIATTVGDRFR